MRIKLTGLAVMAVALLPGPRPAWAEPIVTLTSRDGATTVEGELLGHDGQTYTLRTSLGTITIAADQVTCAGEGCPGGTASAARFDAPAEFALQGSNIIGDGLIPELVDGFALSLEADAVREVGAARNERVFRVTTRDGAEIAAIPAGAHGTATAFPALAEGAAAFGLASRRMAGREAGLPDLRDGPAEHILALDGLVAIVHPQNPVRALTLDQLAAVFAGRITDWSQLGGPPLPVSLYLPDGNSGTMALFEDLILRPRRMQPADSAERLEDHADLSDLVSIDPGGIGLTGFAFARASRMLAIRLQCGLVSAPASFAIKTEEYPLARRLYLYGDPAGQPPQARAFLDYILSDAAQPLIADAGFVDRGIESQGIAVQGARLANSITSPEEFSLPVFREMLTELRDAERLSLTFRFTPASTRLETRSQSEAERFARLLASGAYPGKEVLLVGFTDSVGDFAVNRGLAERRAQSVLETLWAAAPGGALADAPILVQSYGELTPVGCNETAEGRELNRRVEVWVRDKRG
jgi:phosphate transport system substrate-binding protein